MWRNICMHYYNKENALIHSAKGTTWQKKNHGYINRVKKNGKWFYVYKNGKKYNKIQDWLGVDELDAYKYYTGLPFAVEMLNLSDKLEKDFNRIYDSKGEDKIKARADFVKTYAEIKKREKKSKFAIDNFYKTPIGQITKNSRKVKSFIEKVKNKSKFL